ncbi:MAG: hypothetical protein HQL39_17425, partial [Alphaproteobacteria bacterium]|nr:hypothetical protein [Alphaproteobacteria bacterium]
VALRRALDGLSLVDAIARVGLAKDETQATFDLLERLGEAERRGRGRGVRWYAVEAAPIEGGGG